MLLSVPACSSRRFEVPQAVSVCIETTEQKWNHLSLSITMEQPLKYCVSSEFVRKAEAQALTLLYGVKSCKTMKHKVSQSCM